MLCNNLIYLVVTCPLPIVLSDYQQKEQHMEFFTPERLNGARLVGLYTPGSPEWHAERSLGIGGSEVGTILGLNQWESAYALWAKKLNLIPSEIKENWAIRFGKAFEAPILNLWAEEHPEYEVFETGTYADEFCDYRRANPDAIARHRETGELMVVEVKTARMPWDEVPRSYLAQVQHYMGVLKIHKGIIVAVAGMTWNEYDVPFNQDLVDVQNEALDRFWNSVQTETKPDWDGSESTYNAVKYMNPALEDSEVDLGELGQELYRAQIATDEGYKYLMLLKSRTLDTMGSAKHGLVDNIRVASRQIRAGSPTLIVNKKANL
jgi:putative phage-type endonuclease